VRVDLVYFTGCPNVAPMRELLSRCLARVYHDTKVIEVNTDDPSTAESYRSLPSPTVLVDGVDVLGGDTDGAAACRTRLPTEDELLSALRRRQSSGSVT
jgi:hypothetical protein